METKIGTLKSQSERDFQLYHFDIYGKNIWAAKYVGPLETGEFYVVSEKSNLDLIQRLQSRLESIGDSL